MKRIPFLLLLLLLSIWSCKPGIEKTISKRGTIPEARFIEILTEYSIVEGILNAPQLEDVLEISDSVNIFTQIIESKGYTNEDLSHTLRYYFLRKPDRLEDIYDEVLKNISEMEARITARITAPKEAKENLWNGKHTYFLPQDGVSEKIAFNIAIKDTGEYILAVKITMFPDDQSLEPAITAEFWYDNGTPEGFLAPWPRTEIFKDGLTHDYEIKMRNSNPSVTHIRGYLLDHAPQPGIHWEKYVRIDKINLVRVLPDADVSEEQIPEEE